MDDDAARRARAEGLRQRIATLKSGQTAPAIAADDSNSAAVNGKQKTDDETTPSDESPREFVHRRMRELDRDHGKGDLSDEEPE
jgi:hypothetical protein